MDRALKRMACSSKASLRSLCVSIQVLEKSMIAVRRKEEEDRMGRRKAFKAGPAMMWSLKRPSRGWKEPMASSKQQQLSRLSQKEAWLDSKKRETKERTRDNTPIQG